VAEVIASVMETAIFAYLGLFVLSDKHLWDLRLSATAILGCILSRGMMVVLISAIINFFVWLDLGSIFSQICTCGEDEEEGETIESMGSTAKIYLNRKTQQILLLAGVRGAVSFALVENIPVYDAVRKTGSVFKVELKAMTSVSILFTVFVFGALTYFLVKKEKEERVTNGALARRLLSAPLNSASEDDESVNDSVYDVSSI
jgi:NhaP-type Na+/H+ or K+/H+ antiporter